MARIFSGVQPTGSLHLGNYLGAIKNFVSLQGQNECIYCVVDMHAITIWQDPSQIADNTREVTAAFLASGLDPKKSIIFNQSRVSQHAEIGWVFNCVARIGWLNRMTQFKEKAGKIRENASVGLYVYPNLMAADILAYKATRVPVGEDQKQHLELTRDIAQKFNNDFGIEFFPIVEPLIMKSASRIMSLRDGQKKMSKSDLSDFSRLNLNDDEKTLATKIKKARTDSKPVPDGSIEGGDRVSRPEAFNLMEIYSALNDQAMPDVQVAFGGKPFSIFKEALTEVVLEKLGPIKKEMERLLKDKVYVEGVLSQGAVRARKIAIPVREDLFKIIGFIQD